MNRQELIIKAQLFIAKHDEYAKIIIDSKIDQASELIADFFESIYNDLNFGKVMTMGAEHFEQKIHMEQIQHLIREQKNVVIISGHNLPSNETLAEMIDGVKRKHPEYFEEFKNPIPITIPERFEPTYFEDKPKGHKRPYKFHK